MSSSTKLAHTKMAKSIKSKSLIKKPNYTKMTPKQIKIAKALYILKHIAVIYLIGLFIGLSVYYIVSINTPWYDMTEHTDINFNTEYIRATFVVDPENKLMYITANDNGMRVFDYSDFDNPIQISSFAENIVRIKNLCLFQNNLFLLSDNFVYVYDISDAESPVYLKTYSFADSVQDLVITSENQIALVSFYWLRIYDVSDMLNWELLGNREVRFGDTHSLFWDSGILYIAENIEGVSGLNINDPENIQVVSHFENYGVGQYRLVEDSSKVIVHDNFLYIFDYYSGMAIYNLSQPAEQRIPTNIFVSSGANNLEFSGNYMFLSDHRLGVKVYDNTNPMMPERVVKYQDKGYSHHIYVEGNNTITMTENGVSFLEFGEGDGFNPYAGAEALQVVKSVGIFHLYIILGIAATVWVKKHL
jgi:hypothetical protein